MGFAWTLTQRKLPVKTQRSSPLEFTADVRRRVVFGTQHNETPPKTHRLLPVHAARVRRRGLVLPMNTICQGSRCVRSLRRGGVTWVSKRGRRRWQCLKYWGHLRAVEGLRRKVRWRSNYDLRRGGYDNGGPGSHLHRVNRVGFLGDVSCAPKKNHRISPDSRGHVTETP